jgi:hypothetical protein
MKEYHHHIQQAKDLVFSWSVSYCLNTCEVFGNDLFY